MDVEVTEADKSLLDEIWLICIRASCRKETADDAVHQLIARHRSTAHATGFAEGVESERARIIAWLRMQDEKGAEIALSHEKGTTIRAAFGGGSLALSRAADAIQSGEYLADLPEALKPSTDPAKEGGDPRYEELLKLAEGMAEAAEYLRRNLCDGDDADLDDDGDEIEPFDHLSNAVVAFRIQHQKDTEHG